MASCKLIIEDEVNIKIEGLDVDVRRQLANALKFEVPYAKHMPQYKLGRWDGKVAFFGIGGSGYVNHLDVVQRVLTKNNVEIADIDDRRMHISLNFKHVTEDYWKDQGVVWPEGHPAEGEDIILRDYQVEAINTFLDNPQSLQQIATGAGKCRTYDSTMDIDVGNSDFAEYLLNKVRNSNGSNSMNVATFCKTYQRKMWKSMITRKKLDFTLLDVITFNNEQLYYIPYNGYHKFTVSTSQCLKCNAALVIGFRKDEFIVSTCKCSADNKNYATLEKLSTVFPVSEANDVLSSFAERKTRNLQNVLTHWTSRGHTHEDAVQLVSDVQASRSSLSPAAQKGARGYSMRTPEYWIKQGYSKSDAVQKVSNLQVTNGLEFYVNRYGTDEGKVQYDKRMTKWLTSYTRAMELDPTINERKMVGFCKASKESLTVLMPVYEKYNDKIRIYLGIDGNTEYFLRDDDSIRFYDFTIPELKIIVEFNGSKFHANAELLSEQQLLEWKSLFSNESADLVIAKDTVKRKIAECHGYTLLTIWDTDDVDQAITKITNLIEEKLNEI